MASNNGKYNIKAVSNIVGIQPGTLRAWERRYKIVRPIRNEAGHRLYTDEHLKILKWLMEKVERGFTISQAVSLLENKNESDKDNEESLNQTNQIQSFSQDIQHALLSFNEKEAQLKLDYVFSIFSPEKVAIDIVGPILVNIGKLWEENEITSAHEHFATNFLRSRIGMMLISHPSDQLLPKALCVCGPNERHEIGLLIFTLYLKRKGYDVVYLGQSISSTDIDEVIKELEPKYLFMSCTLKKNVPDTINVVDAIRVRFPELIIGLGGHAYDSLTQERKETIKPHLVGKTREDWDNWLSSNK